MEGFAFKIDDAVKASLYKICRLCGIDNPRKVPILNNNGNSIVDVDEPGLSRKIEILINMIVTENDKLPQSICIGCRDKINDFYDFKELCHATETQTRNLLGLDPIKTDKNFDPKSEILQIKDEGLVTANCSLKRGRKRKSEDLLVNNQRKPVPSSSVTGDLKTESSSSSIELNNNDKKKKRIMESRLTKNQEIQQQTPEQQLKKEPSLVSAKKTTKKYFKTCTVCRNRFGNKKTLDKHQRDVHVATVYRYFCIACNAAFRSSAEIKSHQSLHKSQRMPYICGLCDESVPNYYAYTRHLHGHEQPMPIGYRVYNRECPKCRGSYATNFLYNTHHCAIDAKRCGGCGNTFADQYKYLRHAPFCSLAYLIHSQYISGEVAETESQVRIKNEATEPERDVEGEWCSSHKKSGKRESAKEFQMRADKLLKSTIETLGAIKLEPEIHLDDNHHHHHHHHHHADANANEVEAENDSEEDNCIENEFHLNDDHHFNTNNDSDDEVDDSPTTAAAASSADAYIEPQILNENNAEDNAREFEFKKELLAIVPPLKLKITNKEGQLNSSFAAGSDDNSNRHEKKKKKKKHKDEKRQKISYEVSQEPSTPEIKIKIEKDHDEDDDDGGDGDMNEYGCYVNMNENTDGPAPIMTAIPITQRDISSYKKPYTVSGIDVIQDALTMAFPLIRVTARKSTGGIPRIIKQEINDTIDEGSGDDDHNESTDFRSISQTPRIKQEPIDEEMTVEMKEEILNSSTSNIQTSQIPSEIDHGIQINPDVIDSSTENIQTSQIPSEINHGIRIKQEIIDSPIENIQTSPIPSEMDHGARIKQEFIGSPTENIHTSPIPSGIDLDIRIKQEIVDTSTENIQTSQIPSGIDHSIRIKQEIVEEDQITSAETQATMTNPPQIPYRRSEGTLNVTARKSTGGINRMQLFMNMNSRIKQEITSDDSIQSEIASANQGTTNIMSYKNPCLRVTARKSTGGIPRNTQPEGGAIVHIKQELIDDDEKTVETEATVIHNNPLGVFSDHRSTSAGALLMNQVKYSYNDDKPTTSTQAAFNHPQSPSMEYATTSGLANIRIKQEKVDSDDNDDTDSDVETQPAAAIKINALRHTARKSTGGIPFFDRQINIKQEPLENEQAPAVVHHSQYVSGQGGSSSPSMMTFKNPFTSNGSKEKVPQIMSVQSSATPTNIVIKEEPIYMGYSDSTETAQEPSTPPFDLNNTVVVVFPQENTNVLEHGEIQECRVTDIDNNDTLAADEAEEAMEDVATNQFDVNDSNNMYINNDQSTTSLGLMITNVQGQAAVPKGDNGNDDQLPLATITSVVAATTTSPSTDMVNASESLLNNIEECSEIVATATDYDPETFSGNVEYKKDLESQAQPVLDEFPTTSTASSSTMVTMPNYLNDEEEQQNVLNHELLAQNATAAAPSSSIIFEDPSIPETTATTTLGGDVRNEETENIINEQQQVQDEQQQQHQQQQHQPALVQQQMQLAYDTNNINEIAENNNNANIERELSTTQREQQRQQQQQQEEQQQQQQNNINQEEHSQADENDSNNSGNI